MNLHPDSGRTAKPFHIFCAVILLVTMAAIAPICKATSFFIRPMSEFTLTAQNIARGVLHDIHVENGMTPDGGKTLFTYATFDITDVIKGQLAIKTSILVRKVGGTKDGMTLEIPSSPDFSENEDTVLFLSGAREDQSYEVTGLELGKFGTKEEGDETFLTGGLLAYSVSEHAAEHSNAKPQALKENQRPWTIRELKEVVRKYEADDARPPSPQDNGGGPQATSERPGTSVPVETPTSAQTKDATILVSESKTPAGPGPLAYGVAIFLALGIFLFFRRTK